MNERKRWLYLYWKGKDGEPDIGYGIEKRGLWYIGASLFTCSLLLAFVFLMYLPTIIGTLAISGIGVFRYYQSFKHYSYYEIDKYGKPIRIISSGFNIPARVTGKKLFFKSSYLREKINIYLLEKWGEYEL